MPRNHPPNSVPNVPADPDSHPSFSYYYLSYSSDSSENNYYKIMRRTKKNKIKHRSKNRYNEPIKKCAKLTAKLLAYNILTAA